MGRASTGTVRWGEGCGAPGRDVGRNAIDGLVGPCRDAHGMASAKGRRTKDSGVGQRGGGSGERCKVAEGRLKLEGWGVADEREEKRQPGAAALASSGGVELFRRRARPARLALRGWAQRKGARRET